VEAELDDVGHFHRANAKPLLGRSHGKDVVIGMHPREILTSFAFALLVACSSNGAQPIQLPALQDVSAAPLAIRTAAQAVVRVETANVFATGSFISPSGILLTNNHVLGVNVCPREGCYARITSMYQRGSVPDGPHEIFIVPLAVDVGLDMAVLQAYQSAVAPMQPLDTPQYLTIDSRDPAELRGVHVNVVGHPEGHLKKWTQGQVVDSNGTWITFTAYSLPGSSGSPVLDDDGHLVGLLHRGPTAQDLVSNNGVQEYSQGTASAALVPAMSAPLPAAMWSITTSTSDDVVVQREYVYRNARASTANVNGGPKPVLTSLGAACDAALARADYSSPEDLSSGLAPCFDALLWIECRGDTQGAYGVCPQDVSVWAQRYQSAFARWWKLNGDLELDLISFGAAALTPSKAEGTSAAMQNLQHALAIATPPLDFQIADYLAAFGIDSYAGMRIVDFVRGYASVPGYAVTGTAVAAAILWLGDSGQLGRDQVISMLQALASDNAVEIGTKLYIEDLLYQAKVLK
jgi:hypothetical protein